MNEKKTDQMSDTQRTPEPCPDTRPSCRSCGAQYDYIEFARRDLNSLWGHLRVPLTGAQWEAAKAHVDAIGDIITTIIDGDRPVRTVPRDQ